MAADMRPEAPCVLCGCYTRDRRELPPYAMRPEKELPLCGPCGRSPEAAFRERLATSFRGMAQKTTSVVARRAYLRAARMVKEVTL